MYLVRQYDSLPSMADLEQLYPSDGRTPPMLVLVGTTADSAGALYQPVRHNNSDLYYLSRSTLQPSEPYPYVFFNSTVAEVVPGDFYSLQYRGVVRRNSESWEPVPACLTQDRGNAFQVLLGRPIYLPFLGNKSLLTWLPGEDELVMCGDVVSSAGGMAMTAYSRATWRNRRVSRDQYALVTLPEGYTWTPPTDMVTYDQAIAMPPGTTFHYADRPDLVTEGYGHCMTTGYDLVRSPMYGTPTRQSRADLLKVDKRWVLSDNLSEGSILPFREFLQVSSSLSDSDRVTYCHGMNGLPYVTDHMHAARLGGNRTSFVRLPRTLEVPTRDTPPEASYRRCLCGASTTTHSDPHITPTGEACPHWRVRNSFSNWFVTSKCSDCKQTFWHQKIEVCPACLLDRTRYHQSGIPLSVMRFGVEIETEGVDYTRQAGEVAAKLGNWSAKGDGSLRGASAEVISPPLPYPAGLAEVSLATERLRNAGARISHRCGLHVHADLTKFSIRQIRAAATLWYAVEPVVLSCLKVGEARAMYCKPMNAGALEALREMELNNDMARVYTATGGSSSRYLAFNLAAYHRHKTVEFRLFNGTLHRRKIMAYVQLAVHTVSWASRHVDQALDVTRVEFPLWSYNDTGRRDSVHRASMLKFLDMIEIIDPSARFHLLGIYQTDEDRPKGPHQEAK